MNPFASLMTPLQSRPGDPMPRPPRVVKAAKPKRPPRKRWATPWPLTNGMCETLIAVVNSGNENEAAKTLGVSPKTVSTQLTRAKKRMGAPNRTLALLMWDRWARTQEDA